MAPTQDTDSDLLIAMRSGDEKAFVTLYRRRQGSIYRFALHMTGSVSTAEDVTQEVFLTLIRADCGYDPQRGTLAGYLYGIARKLLLRQIERNRTAVEQDLDDVETAGLPDLTGPDPLVTLVRREGIEELRRAVVALPKRYREVVVLCDLEEVDYAQAAQ